MKQRGRKEAGRNSGTRTPSDGRRREGGREEMERGGTQLSPSSFPSSFARGRQRVRMQLTAEKKKGGGGGGGNSVRKRRRSGRRLGMIKLSQGASFLHPPSSSSSSFSIPSVASILSLSSPQAFPPPHRNAQFVRRWFLFSGCLKFCREDRVQAREKN